MTWTGATKAVFCLVVFLQLSCHQGMVNAARLRRSVDQNLAITADNKLILFVDGIEITDLKHPNSPGIADIVFLLASTQLIAVRGKEAGADSGFLGSAETFVTDESWKCTDQFEDGWQLVGYNDTAWEAAHEVRPHGEQPHQDVEGISANASWIWVPPVGRESNADKDVYCRKTIGSRGTFAEPKTSLLLMLLAFLLLKN